jgi:hypothetical protein
MGRNSAAGCLGFSSRRAWRTAYTDMVRQVIGKTRANGLIVIAVLQTEDYSCTPLQDGQLQKLPDELTGEAWTQLLDPTLTNDKGLLDGLGHWLRRDQSRDGYSWPVRKGLAANNVLLFDGDNDAGKFTGFKVPSGMPNNSAYTVHPFFYDYGSVSNSKAHWDARFGDLQATGKTVLVTAWNESSNCPKDPDQRVTDALVQTYLPGHNIGLLAFSWDAPPADAGHLVSSTFAPVNS